MPRRRTAKLRSAKAKRAEALAEDHDTCGTAVWVLAEASSLPSSRADAANGPALRGEVRPSPAPLARAEAHFRPSEAPPKYVRSVKVKVTTVPKSCQRMSSGGTGVTPDVARVGTEPDPFAPEIARTPDSPQCRCLLHGSGFHSEDPVPFGPVEKGETPLAFHFAANLGRPVRTTDRLLRGVSSVQLRTKPCCFRYDIGKTHGTMRTPHGRRVAPISPIAGAYAPVAAYDPTLAHLSPRGALPICLESSTCSHSPQGFGGTHVEAREEESMQ